MAKCRLVGTERFTSVFVLVLVGCSEAEQHHRDPHNTATQMASSAQRDGEFSARLESIRSRFKVKPAPVEAKNIPTPPGTARVELDQPLSILGNSSATAFVPNDSFLKPEFDGFKKWNGLKTASVKLPMTASGAVELEDDTSKVRVSFSLRGAQEAAVRTVDGYAFYPGGYRGSDVIHRVHPEGTEDYVVFENKPDVEELVYDVDVSRVAGLRLVSNVLEFMDEQGAPRLRIAPPYVVDSQGKRHEAKIEVSGCDYDNNPAGPWERAVVSAGELGCGVRVKWGGVEYPAMVDPNWSSTGSMGTPRSAHTATLLTNGNALIAGGTNGTNSVATAELYNPASGTFAATGSMTTARYYHSATALLSGQILVAGGYTASTNTYNPASGTFSAAASLSSARQFHTSTLLPSGKVVFVGGNSGSGQLLAAETYDPGSNTFSNSGSLPSGRQGHVSVLLNSGKILIAGGISGASYPSSCFLYDPSGATFATTGALASGRATPAGFLAGNGEAIILGGYVGASTLGDSERFDPVAGTFSAGPSLTQTRANPLVVSVGNGKWLVVGGNNSTVKATEVFDPNSQTFVASGLLNQGRETFAAVALQGGKALVTGGSVPSVIVQAEVWTPFVGGTACSSAGECATGYCADGYCCDTACSQGSCDRCDIQGSVGVCSIVTAGGMGSPPCSVGYSCDGVNPSCATCASDAGCASGYTCTSGACKLILGQTCSSANSCASGNCVDNRCCDTACNGGGCDRCDVAGSEGSCSLLPLGSPGNPACVSGNQCDGVSASCSTCASDYGCAPNRYCAAGGTCEPQKTKGAVCNASAGQDCKQSDCRVCATGQCVDGFCCDTPCDGNCDVCSAAKGASANGSCTILPDGAIGSPSCSPYLCDGNSADCPVTCVNSSDCTAVTSYCSSGQCHNGGENGNTCSSDSECLSNHCVEGYCCNSACSGQCESCVTGIVGTCTPVTGAPVPSKPACLGDNTVCQGTCNGSNTVSCTFPLATTECLAASCANGVEQAQEMCNGQGSCAVVPAKNCSPYACDPAADKCHVNCAVATDCAPGHFCLGTVCTLASNVATGDSCATNEQCISGYCVDNVCCNLPCTATCMSCDGNFNTDGDGQCSPVAGGKDPRGDCEKDTSTQCAADGYCDGEGACRDATPAGDACGVNVCDGALVARQECDGFGNCAHVTDQNCLEYSCDAATVQCKSTCAVSNDCAPGYTCVGSACQAGSSLSDGEVCTLSEQCISGNCVDGVCCDQPCTETCQSCDGNANTAGPGKCSSVADGKDPRNDCPQDPNNVCGADGMCDGQGQCRPRAKSGEPCGQPACDGDSVQTKSCDGFGECLTDTESCSPYNCDSGLKTCKTTCVTTADCSEGATCSSSGLCTLGEASCSNKTTIKQADGSLIDCSPFICQAGQCTATCSANSDCASTASCENGQCVDNGGEGGQSGSGGASGASNSAAPKDDGGCGCRAVQSNTADWRVWGAFALGLGMVARRKTNRRG